VRLSDDAQAAAGICRSERSEEMMRAFTVSPLLKGYYTCQSCGYNPYIMVVAQNPDSVTAVDDALFSGLQGNFPGEPRHGIVRRDRFAQLHGFAVVRL
jgi:hypothetical protein